MTVRLTLLVLLGLAACAKIDPEPSFPDPLITTTRSATNTTVVDTQAYQLEFAAPPDIQMPTHLKIKGFDVLGTDVCAHESKVGIAVFPAGNASADAQGQSFDRSSAVTIIFEGPAVSKVQLSYNLEYTCSGAAQSLQGESVFTMFPSGRIVREDVNILPSSTTLETNGSECGCGASSGSYFFTSYWAFDPTSAVMTTEAGVPVVAGSGTEGGSRACTSYAPNDIALAVGWSGNTTRLFPGGAAAHVFDFTEQNASSLPVVPANVTSAVQISTDCTTALAGLDDPPLIVDGVRLGSSGSDGIYQDFGVHQASFEIRADTIPIPPGFALALDVDRHATIARAPAVAGPVAVVQREVGTRSIMYFPDGLQIGDVITVDPQ